MKIKSLLLTIDFPPKNLRPLFKSQLFLEWVRPFIYASEKRILKKKYCERGRHYVSKWFRTSPTTMSCPICGYDALTHGKTEPTTFKEELSKAWRGVRKEKILRETLPQHSGQNLAGPRISAFEKSILRWLETVA